MPSQSGTLMQKRELKLKRSTDWVSFCSPSFYLHWITLCCILYNFILYLTNILFLSRLCSNRTERCSSACHPKQQDINLSVSLERSLKVLCAFWTANGRCNQKGRDRSIVRHHSSSMPVYSVSCQTGCDVIGLQNREMANMEHKRRRERCWCLTESCIKPTNWKKKKRLLNFI